MKPSVQLGLAAEDLVDLEVLGDAQISPDGGLIAFCATSLDPESDCERSLLRIVEVNRESPKSLDSQVEGRSPRWSPDGGSLALLREDDGRSKLLLVSIPAGEVRELATPGAAAGPAVWSPDASRIALAVEIGQGGPSRITIVDGLSGETRLLRGGQGHDSSPTWSADGTRLAFARGHGPGAEGPSSAIFIAGPDLDEDASEVASDLAFACSPSWSPVGDVLAVYGTLEARLGPEDPALQPWLIPAPGGEARLAAEGVPGVTAATPPQGPTWSGDGSEVFFRESRAGDINLVAAPAEEPGPAAALTDGCQVTGFSAAVDARTIAFSACSGSDPGSVWVSDRTSEPRLVRGRPAPVPPPRRRRVQSPHGEMLDAWLQGLGEGPAPQPLLVCMHGGPHNFVGSGFALGHFHRNVLASRGWIVLTLNSSGSGSYGAGFADSIRGRWGERDLPEYMAAVDALVEEGLADPERLAVAGYSYGGYLAAWAICHTDRFKAAVIGAPITNLEAFEASSDIGAWFVPWEMGDPAPGRDRLMQLSPVTHAARIGTPALILHGEDDRRCPIAQGEELRDRIVAAGRAEVEMVRYPDAGHLFYARGVPSQRIDYNKRIVDWIERHVLGDARGSTPTERSKRGPEKEEARR